MKKPWYMVYTKYTQDVDYVIIILTVACFLFVFLLVDSRHHYLSRNDSCNLSQLFENQVVKVSKKGWHSLKYRVNMVIICMNMVILCINKRLTICLIDIILNILIVKYREKLIKMTRLFRKWNFVIFYLFFHISSYIFTLKIFKILSFFCIFFIVFHIFTLRMCPLIVQVTLY